MNVSRIIRQDKEFSAFLECFTLQMRKETPLPIVVNGIAGGATDAFITECVVENSQKGRLPALILTPDDTERSEIASMLIRSGLRVAEYKARELVFHNISASHDVDRERLLVLSHVDDGTLDAIFTTPSAALGYTMPKDVLEANSLSLRLGDEIAPARLVGKLVGMGFASVDSVEARGQFSKRGGIVDNPQDKNLIPFIPMIAPDGCLGDTVFQVLPGNDQGCTLDQIGGINRRRTGRNSAEDQGQILLAVILADTAMNTIGGKSLCGANAAFDHSHVFLLIYPNDTGIFIRSSRLLHPHPAGYSYSEWRHRRHPCPDCQK